MTLQQYELLIDLAETGNITRTAENLGYSQPGASHIIRNIEKELGFPVITREKYGVHLTAAAELLIPDMRQMMRAQEKLTEKVNAINGLEYGNVTVGAYSSVATHLLPEIIRDFHALHPGLVINIREGGAEQILQWMQHSQIDCAFISRPYISGMDFRVYGYDPLVAVLPSDYDCKDDYFPIKDFQDRPFVISAAGNDLDIHRALKEVRVDPQFCYSVLDDQTIMAMVEKGLGLSILTKLIVDGTRYQLKILPTEPVFYREMGIAVPDYQSLSGAVRTFVDFSYQRLKASQIVLTAVPS
ncbi:MAG: LysR family transcriptional regulator [Eubacteriales bacterium]|jgi:DNA-binding transcriptional LysR family regulator